MSTIKDRSRLCAFSFADGRQCRTPRRSGHPHLCYFHAQKEAEALAAKQAGEDISSFLPFNRSAFRLRSELRNGAPLLRRCPRPNQAQSRLHARLSQPDHDPIHPHRPA